MSTLSTFIRENSSEILSEWETFARELPSGSSMSVDKLRDHAEAMLEAIALDLETPQTPAEQSDKSKGLAAQCDNPPTAAAQHGRGRAEVGFTVVHMVAEFRALRATVIRLWMPRQRQFGLAELNDLIRFNEAIDQAIAESLARYTREIDETRERFLAILGHDLRNPLGAIATSADFLLELDGLTAEQKRLIQGIVSARGRMSGLVTDMLELALSRLGDGVPVTRSRIDLGEVVRDVAAEVQASYPRATIECDLRGELIGDWDSARLAQALTNLLGNAVQHGSASTPISVSARASEREVVIAVHNHGPAIPDDKLRRLFGGMTQEMSADGDRRHLGLGLYIVEKIVQGHGGAIDVQSAAGAGTTFSIRLPKSPEAN
jgi:signal transduction histidine kinase